MQRRADSKPRLLTDDTSTSLLSTKSSTSTAKTSSSKLQKPSQKSTGTGTIPSPKVKPSPTLVHKTTIRSDSGKQSIPAKSAVKKTVPILALTKISSANASGRSNLITTTRQRVPADHTTSENVSMNTSISTSVLNNSHQAPLSLNTSQTNAKMGTGPVTAREETGAKTSRPVTQKTSSRQGSMDLQTESPETVFERLQLPISGIKALKLFKMQLSTYEQGEILDFQSVYFLGFQALKIRQSSSQLNFGYDDERGDYQIAVGDHLSYRYEVLSILGRGSFGQVLKVQDHKTGEFLAVKIIRNKSRFHHQAAVEVKILRFIRDKDAENDFNVIHMRDYFVFRKHLCITFELLTINLYDFIKSNNFQGLSSALIKRFAGQILVCLRALRKLKVIHCDLKPENILLKQQHKSGIKVIDFGSSCFDDERVYTYIQSRFYRAPEVILGIPYTSAIDMWSMGCILAELATGLPLFPGESEYEQLLCIMEIRGIPPNSVLDVSTRKKMFFDPANSPKIVANKRGKKRFPNTRALSDVLGSRDPSFIDFLDSKSYTECFEWDPCMRLTPDEALVHPWLREDFSVLKPAATPTTRSGSSQPHQHRLGANTGNVAHRQKLSLVEEGNCAKFVVGKSGGKQMPFTTKNSTGGNMSFMFS